jgi:hypothetical protein
MRFAFLVNSIYDPPGERVLPFKQTPTQQHFFIKEAKDAVFAIDQFPHEIAAVLNEMNAEVVEAAWQQVHRNPEFNVEHWTFRVVSVLRLD